MITMTFLLITEQKNKCKTKHSTDMMYAHDDGEDDDDDEKDDFTVGIDCRQIQFQRYHYQQLHNHRHSLQYNE